jgi:phage terminase large subunit-like protein
VAEQAGYGAGKEMTDADKLLLVQMQESVRNSLISFCRYVDPSQERWYGAQHLGQIADILMRVERGELKRVIIAVPPRHWKSSLASEKFPAWYLGRNPKASVIVASYAVSLAEKFSKSVRLILGSERYKSLFDVEIKRDSNSADDWLLEGGYRTSFRAVGTGGGISGHGAKLIILDDVSDPNKVNSPTQTTGDWEWYKNVIRPRAENDTAIIVINNRVGVNDITGYLLDKDRNDSSDPPQDWTYIEMPAYDAATDLYLWEGKFGRDHYEKLRLDPTLWRIQYMQSPVVASGTLIHREWFEFVANLPKGASEQCRSIDTAWTVRKTNKKDPDYFASVGSCMHGGWMYLVEPFKTRMEMPDAVNWIQNEKKLKPRVRFGMAQGSGEQIAKQFLGKLGIPIEGLAAERVDIVQRLVPFISHASRGLVKLVGDPSRWEAFLDEATSFRGDRHTHDDLLACCVGLMQMHGLVVTNRQGTFEKPKNPFNIPAFTMR